ncbi:MAG: hypothetical protein RLZZ506_797 [Bacteroidota bacterium]
MHVLKKASLLRHFMPLVGFLGAIAIAAYFYNPKPIAKGDKQYGGTLKISSKNEGLLLFPLANNTLDHQRLQGLIFEPLLKPAENERGWRYCLASKIKPNDNGNKVEIQLRKNIHFADDPCFRFHSSELTSEDVAFSLSLACSQQANVQQDLMLPEVIVGGHSFYQQGLDPLKKTVQGIKIKDDYTLEITLTRPYNHFLNLLSAPNLAIISKQAAAYYGEQIMEHPVGTGPFQLRTKKSKRYTFERNPSYWRYDKYGNQLPYLSQVELTCGVPGQLAHQYFLKNKIDLLFDLPIDELQDAFGTLNDAKSGKNPLHEVYIKNAAKTHFIQFNCAKPPFNNVNVRKAFALAIDAQVICNDVLKGEGRELNQQFIPGQKHYKNSLIQADSRPKSAKIEAAKLLISNAGYNRANPLPTVVFYVGASKKTLAYKWSSAAAKMISEALGVLISLKEASPPRSTNAQQGFLWRTGWVGDYPGAESYLRLFYSKTQKPCFFKNDVVDVQYLQSVLAPTPSQMKAAQMRCELAILAQQALIPVYTEDFIVLNQLRLRGFELDASGMLDFGKLYMKELK